MASQVRVDDEGSTSPLPLFPLSRHFYMNESDHSSYYPYGNTPAEDYLESSIDNLQPSVLILGCGDLRSCFYTLWKNFDPSISVPKRFTGVTFSLNDNNAAVLARNMVFLHLCLQLPKDSLERKKWISAMWAIWYCHELHPHHLKILNCSLKYLLSFANSLEQWNRKDNLMSSCVQIDSSSCLEQISKMWKMWLHKLVSVTSVNEMQESRRQKQTKLNDISEHCCNFTKDYVFIYGEEESVTRKKIHARSSEVRSYIESGNCFAENVFHFRLPRVATSINLTMYDRQDGMYTGFFALMPYGCYYHSFEFSLSKLQSLLPKEDVRVSPSSFKSNPFLANSVQQFSMWVQSAGRVLNDKNLKVLFSVYHEDAIELCQSVQQRNNFASDGYKISFDVVTSSNLMDHIGPINLVLAGMPLLKDNGLLKTTTMSCKFCKSTREEFLNMCFGLDCQFFPTVLGIRCIDQEGGQYGSSVMAVPLLPDLSHIRKRLPHNRSFLWENVQCPQPTVLHQLPSIADDNITESLLNAVGACIHSMLNYSPKHTKSIILHHGIETALLIIKKFASLCDQSSSNFLFWDPFCTAIRDVCQPFLQCLQTQMLLHNIHAHLTVTEANCPLCKNESLEKSLQLFNVTLPNKSCLAGAPHLFSLIHLCSSRDLKLLKELAKEGKNVHIFDVFDSSTKFGSLQLKFFAPHAFLESDYKLTIVSYSRATTDEMIVCTSSLKCLTTEWQNYDYLKTTRKCQNSPSPTKSDFGIITSHICEKNKSETELTLLKESQAQMDDVSIGCDKTDSQHIEINCGALHKSLHLTYPADVENIQTGRPRGDKLSVVCARQTRSFYEERICKVTSPDNLLSIPPVDISRKIITEQSHMQFTIEEEKSLRSSAKPLSPITKLKLTMQKLFMSMSATYFQFLHKDKSCCGLVIKNKMLFDYEHKTPALDIAFCFTNQTDTSNTIWEDWKQNIPQSMVKTITVEEDELQLLKQTFSHFSRKTNASLESVNLSCQSAGFQGLKLNGFFTRAVLYLLLSDPDVKLYRVGEECRLSEIIEEKRYENLGGTKCNNCGKLSFTTKKCDRCKLVCYCNKKCQLQHWPVHKVSCYKSKSESSTTSAGESTSEITPRCAFCRAQLSVKAYSSSTNHCCMSCQEKYSNEHQSLSCNTTNDCKAITNPKPSCSYCSSFQEKLLKCLGCKQVQYCNKSCQKNHWPEHRKTCSTTGSRSKSSGLDYGHDSNKSVRQTSCTDFETFSESSSKWGIDLSEENSGKLAKQKQVAGDRYTCDDSKKHLPTTPQSIAPPSNEKRQSQNWPGQVHSDHFTEKGSLLSEQDEACGYCNRACATLKLCTKCKSVKYCTKYCQRRHWPKHRFNCYATH